MTTTLSGTTNYLLNSDVQALQRLVQELRTTFRDESEMTLQALQQLPYLNAVIEEGLRIVTPVPLSMSRVVAAGGDTVCGHLFPEVYVLCSCFCPFSDNTDERRHEPTNPCAMC